MNIVFSSPYKDNKYYNICYNYYEFGEVATYIKNNMSADEFKLFDLSVTDDQPIIADFFNFLKTKNPTVVIWCQFKTLPKLATTIQQIKEVVPQSKIIAYGTPVSMIPRHFLNNYPIDIAVKDVPWEFAIEKALLYLNGDIPLSELAGVELKDQNKIIQTQDLSVPRNDYWHMPDLDLLPIDDYFKIYQTSTPNAGYNNKKELSFSLSRGCERQCKFCTVNHTQGNKQINKKLDDVFAFINHALQKQNFDFISIFSANFTQDKRYVLDFCARIKPYNLEWKCVTSIHKIDTELVATMAESGCVRIGFGLETLSPAAQKYIQKFCSREQLENTIALCRQHKIIPCMFIMLGIPGETKETFDSMVRFLHSNQIPMRVTAYTPYYLLQDNMAVVDVLGFDRQTKMLLNVLDMSERQFNLAVRNIEQYIAEEICG